jgi:hypothetical protein
LEARERISEDHLEPLSVHNKENGVSAEFYRARDEFLRTCIGEREVLARECIVCGRGKSVSERNGGKLREQVCVQGLSCGI